MFSSFPIYLVILGLHITFILTIKSLLQNFVIRNCFVLFIHQFNFRLLLHKISQSSFTVLDLILIKVVEIFESLILSYIQHINIRHTLTYRDRGRLCRRSTQLHLIEVSIWTSFIENLLLFLVFVSDYCVFLDQHWFVFVLKYILLSKKRRIRSTGTVCANIFFIWTNLDVSIHLWVDLLRFNLFYRHKNFWRATFKPTLSNF